MNKKIILGIVFLLSLVNVFAQISGGRSDFDLDDDRVCDWEEGHSEYNGVVDISDLDCTITKFGDKCLGTDSGINVDRGRNSETSGCPRDQIERFFDYWSVVVKELSPSSVKMNWLLDQSRGMEVYQSLEFVPNLVAERENVDVVIESLRFDCEDITEEGNFRRFLTGWQEVDLDGDKSKTTLKLSLRKADEEELGGVSVLESPQDIYRKAGDPSLTVKEIIVSCNVRINQHRNLEDGQKSYFFETEDFTFFIPIQALVIQPPDQALDVAKGLSSQIVDRTDDLLWFFDKARRISDTGCVFSSSLLLLSSLTKNWPIIGGVYEVAVKIWRGEGSAATVFSTEGSGGYVGGKAFCRYSACPSDWCPAMQTEFYKDPNGKWRPGDAGEEVVPLKNLFEKENKYVQDNLILSVRCGCISGIQMNLAYINAIFKEFNRCLDAASRNREYTSVCEEYLRTNICTYVLGQGSDYLGKELLEGAFEKIKAGTNKVFGEIVSSVLPEREASVAQLAGRQVESSLANAMEVYKDEGFGTISRSYARGSMGYKSVSTNRLICESVFYGKLPSVNALGSYQSEVGLKWKTNYHTSYYPEIAYYDANGNPVYNLKISWFVISGQDDFCYRVFLEDENGATKDIPIPSEPGGEDRRVGRRCLEKAGEYNSDYLELLDSRRYERICFFFEKEAPQKQCFSRGTHSSALELESVDLSGEETDDRDGDGLPDWWENRYNCMPEMASWTEDQFKEKGADKDICLGLLNKGRINKLDPSLKDSDGDGVDDNNENPDNDVYDNFDEYDENYNPNVAGQDAIGRNVLAECNIDMENIRLIASQSLGEVPQYNVGDSIAVEVNGVVRTYEEGRELSTNDIALFVKISGPSNFFQNMFVEWNDAVNGVNLFEIEEDMNTGSYTAEIEAVYEKGISKIPCVDTNKDYQRILERKNFVVVNNDKPGCIDTDNGDKTIGGTCFDSTGIERKDSCGVNGLIEWACRENKCEQLTNFGCSNFQQCLLDNEEEGVCVNTCSVNVQANSCIEKNKDGEITSTKYAECSENEVVKYMCSSGLCVQDVASKINCGVNNICYKEEGKSAVCSAKCFDSDGGVNPDIFGAGIVYITRADGTKGMEKFWDECGNEETLIEKGCTTDGEFDTRPITCSNSCVGGRLDLRYDPLGIRETGDSAKCT